MAAPAALDHPVTRGPASLRFLAGLDADLRQSLLNQIRDAWTHNSTALEGNSLSLGDTKFVIEEGLTVAGKPIKDHQEVIGHAAAITQIYDLLDRDVTADDLFALHRSVQAERVVDIHKPLGSWKVEPNGTYAVDEPRSPTSVGAATQQPANSWTAPSNSNAAAPDRGTDVVRRGVLLRPTGRRRRRYQISPMPRYHGRAHGRPRGEERCTG